MKTRKHFYFSGRVQEVGFRFQACRIAQSLGAYGLCAESLGRKG